MRKFYCIKMFLATLLITACEQHDTTKINDNGMWVSIYAAPKSSNYILHNDSVYGICVKSIDSINWEEIWSNPQLFPIDNVDIRTFYINISNESCNYAKDSKYVYCPTFYWCYDTEEELPYSYIFNGDIRIPAADPKTFKYLGDGFAVDKHGMYLCGEKIEWNDSIVEYYNRNPD